MRARRASRVEATFVAAAMLVAICTLGACAATVSGSIEASCAPGTHARPGAAAPSEGSPTSGSVTTAGTSGAAGPSGRMPERPGAPPAPDPQLPLMAPQVGHTDKISQIVYTGDGRTMVSTDGVVKVWDTRTTMVLRTLELPDEEVLSVAITPDDTRVVAGTRNGRVVVWDIATGALLGEFVAEGADYVSKVGCSPDGTRIVVGGRGRGFVLDTDTLRELGRVDTGGHPTHAVGFDGDRALLALQPQGHVELWDIATRRRLHTFRHRIQPRKIVFSPDGRLLGIGLGGNAAGGYKRIEDGQYEILLFDTRTGSLQQTLPGQRREACDVAFSLDGRRMVSCGPDTVYVWDRASGQVEWEQSIYPRNLTALGFAPDGESIAVGTQPMNHRSSEVVVMGARSRTITASFGGTRWVPVAAEMDAAGSVALIGSLNEQVSLWDLRTGALIRTLTPEDDWRLADVAISADGKRGVAGSVTNLELWDLEAGTARPLRLGKLWTRDVDISPDGRRVLGVGHYGTVIVWDFDTGRRVARLDSGVEGKGGSSAAFMPDGESVVWVNDSRTLELVQLSPRKVLRQWADAGWMREVHPSENGKLAITTGDALTLFTLDGSAPPRVVMSNARDVVDVAIHPDGRRAYVVRGHAVLTEVDLGTGAELRRLAARSGHLGDVHLSGDGRLAITADADGSARLWALDTGESMSLVASGSEWVLYGDDGLFDASRRGGDLVAASYGRTPVRIDQLAVRYNRPDRLLGRLGNAAPGFTAHLRAQHERRVERMGLHERSGRLGFAGAPTVALASVTPEGDRARVIFSAESRLAPLSRFDVYVNEVPVFGLEGQPLSGARQQVDVRVPIAAGASRIEVSATNDRGVESFRDVTTVTAAPRAKPDLYVLAFGVSRYANPAYDLEYAHKDALDLVEVFRAMQGRTFGRVHAHAFTDDGVTVASLRQAKSLLAAARPSDDLVVFVAGHGMYAPDARADYYFLTHEAEPRALRETAAPFALVEDLVQGVAPLQKLLLIDTCTSGDRSEQVSVAGAGGGSRGLAARSVRALSVGSGTSEVAPRDYLLSRDRYIYNDLLRRSGAVVLSSSQGAELSYETTSLRNGVFSKALLTALTTPAADADHDGMVSLVELRGYVTTEVPRATGGLQHPVVDHDNPTLRLAFPIASDAAGILGREDPKPTSVRRPRALVLPSGSETAEAGGRPCRVETEATPSCLCRAAYRPGGAPPSLAVLLGLAGGALARRRYRRPPSHVFG